MTKNNHYSPLLARIYDKVLHIPIRKIRKSVADELNSQQFEKIIDMCCGTGNQLKYLRHKGFLNLKGIDVSDNMLRQSYRNGLNGICQKMDASVTDFHDNSFDAAVISFALHEMHARTASAVMKETKRIVREGGRIVIVDYCFDDKTLKIGKLGARGVEKMVGGDHYRNFKFYIRTKLMFDLTEGLKLQNDKRFIFGAVRMWSFENISRLEEV